MQKDKVWEWIESLLVFSLLIYVYCTGLGTVPFHPDESGWIATSSVFEAYITGDTSSPLWKVSYWSGVQPPLPRYLIGLGRSIGGVGLSALNQPWDFEKDYNTNVKEGRLPSDKLLWWSRLPMGILAAISIFAGYIFLKRSAGKLSAYIWIGLCVISSYFPLLLKRAMGESPLLATIVLIMLITFWVLRASDKIVVNKPTKLYLYFLLFGVGIGLAESSKLNGLSTIAAGFIIAIIIAFRKIQTLTRKIIFILLSTLILIFSSQSTFVSLNPYLWPDPLIRNKAMFNLRIDELNNQQIDFPVSRIEGIENHFKVLANRIFQSYAAVHINGFLIINIIFFIVGLSYILIKSLQYLKYLDADPASLAIIIVGASASIPPLFTPLDWDRYYLLPVYFSTLFIAVGLARTILFGYGSFHGKIIHHSTVQNRQ
jgi:4-amino-4-deoxy-L-arabinose transferase-like glycosyltransferase